MPGYAIVIGECVGCNQPFGFNPLRVPSIRVKGKREPVCRQCTEEYNRRRVEAGFEPFEIPEDAYEPIPEEELR